jgi:hypothetical protein
MIATFIRGAAQDNVALRDFQATEETAMGRHSSPRPPPRETLQEELSSVAIAPTLKPHRKRRSKLTATKRPKATTPAEETVRDVLATRKHLDNVNARQAIARQDDELRSARQITAIAAEAAELLLAPAPE